MLSRFYCPSCLAPFARRVRVKIPPAQQRDDTIRPRTARPSVFLLAVHSQATKVKNALQ